jgi:hypothetical protein
MEEVMFFRKDDHPNFDVSLNELDLQRAQLLNIIHQHHGEKVFNNYKKQMEDIVDDLFAAIRNMYKQIYVLHSGNYETYDVEIPSQEDMDARIKSVLNLSGNKDSAVQLTNAIEKQYVNTKKYLQDLLPEIVRESQKPTSID